MATDAINESKTSGIIVAEILMMNATFAGVHFLVEGESDSKFWKRRLSKTSVSIVNCEGKLNLINSSAEIQAQNISAVVGVYDPDFERLQGITHHPEILTPTDKNDLELTMIASEALEALLHEYGDTEKIATFEATNSITIELYLEKISRQFGKLRYINGILNHHVNFDQLTPFRFVSENTWELDSIALINEYARLSGHTILEVENFVNFHCPDTPIWHLSQGHDTLKILAIGLRNCIGRKQINEKDISRILRIAFSFDLFQKTSMHETLRSFESKLHVPLFL